MGREGKGLCMIIINGNWWHNKRVMRMREFRQAKKRTCVDSNFESK